MNNLYFGLLTSHSISGKKSGELLFKSISNFAPSLMPTKYGNYEPLRKDFEYKNLPQILTDWQLPSFVWTNRKKRSSGTVFMSKNTSYLLDSISINSNPEFVETAEIVELAKSLSRTFTPDFSYLHLLTDADEEPGRQAEVVHTIDRIRKTSTMIITGHEIKKTIPDIYWGMVFGVRFVNLLGKEKLLSSPAYIVEEIAENTIYIQISEKISDLKTNFRDLRNMRDEIKRHLGEHNFFQPCQVN